MSDTPRTDAEAWIIDEKSWLVEEKRGQPRVAPVGCWEVVSAGLARQLERDLEIVRDAHMANCLAADTLRAEIGELRTKATTELSQEEYDALVRDAMLWRTKYELSTVALSEARHYRNSNDPIGILARELLLANGETK